MLLSYLYTRRGRLFIAKLSGSALAFTFGAALAHVVVSGIPNDPSFVLQEYDSAALWRLTPPGDTSLSVDNTALPAPAGAVEVTLPAITDQAAAIVP